MDSTVNPMDDGASSPVRYREIGGEEKKKKKKIANKERK
jgi:hypothetical protein